MEEQRVGLEPGSPSRHPRPSGTSPAGHLRVVSCETGGPWRPEWAGEGRMRSPLRSREHRVLRSADLIVTSRMSLHVVSQLPPERARPLQTLAPGTPRTPPR